MTLSLQGDKIVDGVVWERLCEDVAALVEREIKISHDKYK